MHSQCVQLEMEVGNVFRVACSDQDVARGMGRAGGEEAASWRGKWGGKRPHRVLPTMFWRFSLGEELCRLIITFL